MVGSTVSLTDAEWSDEPVAVNVQWTREGKPISGATDSVYLVTPQDAGLVLGAIVQGVAADGTSDSVSVVLSPRVMPSA
jgi:hypothetical protein